MSLVAIKDYFVENVDKYSFRARKQADISVVSYAVNQEEYGVVNIFVGDKSGLRFVLKTGRYDRFDNLYRDRLRSLRSELRDDIYANVRVHILAGEEINIAGKAYLLFPYVNSVNSYMKIRRAIFGRDKIVGAVVDSVFDFCFRLEVGGNARAQKASEKWVETIIKRFRGSYRNDKVNALDDKIQAALKNGRIDIHQTITHNDLGATNVLVGNGTYWITDWEYWDISLGIFNFFDIVLDFGSLIELGVFSKRSCAKFLRIFSIDVRNPFIRKCRQYCEKLGYSDFDPETAWYLLLLYLMNKATCQCRIYGSHYGFDYFWHNMFLQSLPCKDKFTSWWSRLLG